MQHLVFSALWMRAVPTIFIQAKSRRTTPCHTIPNQTTPCERRHVALNPFGFVCPTFVCPTALSGSKSVRRRSAFCIFAVNVPIFTSASKTTSLIIGDGNLVCRQFHRRCEQFDLINHQQRLWLSLYWYSPPLCWRRPLAVSFHLHSNAAAAVNVCESHTCAL